MYSNKYQVDEDLARSIIKCESDFKPEAINKQAKVGEDVSYWQINSFYWKEEMLKKGWDIYNPEHNLEAGFYLLKTKGTTLWSWSKHCWNK